MKLYFATRNKHKVEEATSVLGKHHIQVEHLNIRYLEDKELSMEETAKLAAKQIADKYRKPIIVDDTGIFFTAYKDFPGANAKLMFQSLGYEGLLKLLAGKRRDAFFISCVGFCLPNHEPKVFDGRLDGRITMIPYHLDRDVMPYERIFVPKNSVRTISAMSREQKNKISHRAKAFEKLAMYLKRHSF